MLEKVHSVVVLLTSKYSNRLLVVSLHGPEQDDQVVECRGAMIIPPGRAVAGLHCIETGESLELDSDYAVFHTGKPREFVQLFVPQLRLAISQVGWPAVRKTLKAYLATRE